MIVLDYMLISVSGLAIGFALCNLLYLVIEKTDREKK